MKKVIFISALAIAAAVSCTKSDIVDTKFNEAISFENYLGRDAQTKGDVITSSDLEEINLYGYYTGNDTWAAGTTANLWNPVVLSMGNTGWAVEEGKERYWANDTDKYTFFAYAPIDNTNLAKPSDATKPVLSYTVDTDFSKHVDVLVADPVLNTTKKEVDQNTNKKVDLQLRHKLARLTVKATSDNIPFTFHIKEISISGNFIKTGTFPIYEEDATWTGTPETNPVTYYFANTMVDGEYAKANDANKLPDSKDYADEDTGYMMMIPVTAEQHKATLKVVYSTYDANAEVESRNYELNYEITNSFDMGKAYAISLKFENNTSEILFDVTVNDWTDVDGTANKETEVSKTEKAATQE